MLCTQPFNDIFSKCRREYMDDPKSNGYGEHRFAYTLIMNKEELLKIESLDDKPTVVVFDTFTNYINASHFIETFKHNGSDLTLNDISKSSSWKSKIRDLEVEINTSTNCDNSLEEYEVYDKKRLIYVATYKIYYPISSTNKLCNGFYIHPYLFGQLTLFVNKYFENLFSVNILTKMINCSMDKNLKLSSENEIFETLLLLDDSKSDHIQLDKFKNYRNLLISEHEAELTKKREERKARETANKTRNAERKPKSKVVVKKKLPTVKSRFYAILIVRYFVDDDDEQEFSKYSYEIINAGDIEYYTQEYTIPDESIPGGYSSIVVHKFSQLKNINRTDMEEFFSLLSERMDMLIHTDTEKYEIDIYSNQHEDFISEISKFLGAYIEI